MDELEDRLRTGLTRYADAMQVTRPPLDDVLAPERVEGAERVGGRATTSFCDLDLALEHQICATEAGTANRRRHVLVAAGIAVAGATIVAATVWLPSRESRPDGADSSPDDRRPGQDSTDVAIAPTPCAPVTATGGIVASGRTDDGESWEVRVGGTPPAVHTEMVFAGRSFGQTQSDQLSWAPLVNLGALGWHLEGFAEGAMLRGPVPTSTARVDVHLANGDTVTLCPAVVPGIDAVAWAGGFVPGPVEIAEVTLFDVEGLQMGTVDVAADRAAMVEMMEEAGEPSPETADYGLGFHIVLDPEVVQLPLGDEGWPTAGAEDVAEVASGQLPSGRWALLIGAQDPVLHYELELPGLGAATDSGTEDVLFANPRWHINWIDGRHFVAGLTQADAASVVVGLGDGTSVAIPTVATGVPGFDGRLFAGPLPVGASPVTWEARAADGTVVERAQDGVAGVFGSVVDPGRFVALVPEPAG